MYPSEPLYDDSHVAPLNKLLPAKQYWLTRFVILRLLGIVYAVAFWVAVQQIIPLIGQHGLLPAGQYLQRIAAALGSQQAGFFRLPGIFWFHHSDSFLLLMAWLGFVLSCVVAAGFANAPLMALLWFLYTSFVNIGQEWYGYGWEIQLLETGFLAIFLCPLIDMRPFPKRPPPLSIIMLFRWLIFRIMMGAGMIKLCGDEVWRNGTALYYHFETQPLPGPLTRWFHFLPRAVLKAGVWYNFLAELIAPWFVFWPRLARHIAGVIIVLLQLILMASGNLSFLNWLTIVPALACFDDGFWAKLLPRQLVARKDRAVREAVASRPMELTAWVVVVLVAILSIEPVFNLFSPHQIMNTSFDRLNLVNTYGAFGSVGKERFNVVFEGTSDSAATDSAHWQPYLYKGLPVLTNETPPQVAPYQLRLDWQMWFAAMSTPDDYPWTLTLIDKLLHNDAAITGLFRKNPFAHSPPRYIRVVLYRYRLNPSGNYWSRERLGNWLPPPGTGRPPFAGQSIVPHHSIAALCRSHYGQQITFIFAG